MAAKWEFLRPQKGKASEKVERYGIRSAIRDSIMHRFMPDPKPDDITFRKATSRVFLPLRLALIAGLLGIVLQQLEYANPFGVLLLFASGCALTGVLFGFLFGMPRSMSDGTHVGKGYTPNTNLENISNWLTSALIGIGLVEMRLIQNELNLMVGRIVSYCSLSGYCQMDFLIWSILFTFVLLGFFGGYLRTRMYLPYLFLVSDSKGQLVTKADQEAQDARDRDASSLVESQLAKGGGESSVDLMALRSAIVASSEILKPKFFFRARELRVAGETKNNDEENMQRAIPVFEALMESDRGRNIPPRFHTNYAQLGFIYLRAKEGVRNYAKAVSYLSEAIIVREKQKERGWYNYELCRAIALIRSASPDDQRIYDDLKFAAEHELKMLGDGTNLAAIEDLVVLKAWITAKAAWLAEKERFTMGVTNEPALVIGAKPVAPTT
jgi:tetratricopeptide (TPR) repeat protein